jgi:hypothetical protein
MSLPKIVCGCLLIGVLGTALWQRTAIRQMQNQNDNLKTEQARQITDTSSGGDAPQQGAIAALMESNRDLPKLRNEVRQLREQKTEAARLREANRQLAASSTNTRPARLSEMRGYAAKESWANAGFARPEATLQTWFAAIRDGNAQQFAECLSPTMQEQLRREAASGRQAGMTKAMEFLGKIAGYQIAEREQAAEDRVTLGVRAAANGEVLKLSLQKIDGQWKLDLR